MTESRDRPSDRFDTETLFEDFIDTISHPGRCGGCIDRVQLGGCINR